MPGLWCSCHIWYNPSLLALVSKDLLVGFWFRMLFISGISALKRLANCSSSNEETGNDSNSIINDDEPRDDTYFEIKLLEELFISEFEVVSKIGR